MSCDVEASAEQSSVLGPGLGVYGTGVRLYWPGLQRGDRKIIHPVFVIPRYADVTEDAWWQSANATRRRFRNAIFGVSAFSATINIPATSIYRKAEQAALEKERERLRESENYYALAQSYADENAAIRSDRDKLREDLEAANDKLENLQLALSYRDDEQSDDPGIQPPIQIAPKTVSEAMTRARLDLDDFITFGDSVDKSVASLHPEAGPPDKIYDYLESLAQLAINKRKGALGTGDVRWLMDHNIEASVESETVRNSNKEMRKRRWAVGGKVNQFDFHLKPSDAVAPDRCVRIYFLWNSASHKIEIGYIGKHL